MKHLLIKLTVLFILTSCASNTDENLINEDEKTDPRWDELKKLLTDK